MGKAQATGKATTNRRPRAGRSAVAGLLLGALGVVAGSGSVSAASTVRFNFDWTEAERIIIEKAQRRLTLVRKDKVRRIFPIMLGGNPVGPKREQGDLKTPEGEYVIDYKNLNSSYYLSVRISYPNDSDLERARSLGVKPGGNIMIHGMPNEARPPYSGYVNEDWTEGCIAVSNTAMQEIWLAVRENTPVEIRP